MSPTALRVAAFAGATALVFGVAFVLGSVATTDARGSDPTTGHMGRGMTAGMNGMHQNADPMMTTSAPLPGLAVSRDGYTLTPTASTLPRGDDVPFTSTVVDADGDIVTAYEPTHTKDLHLIVVRRDLSGFQHVHPTRDETGTWSVPLDLAAAGTYRAFADFRPADSDAALTLGIDLQVAGEFDPVPLPAPQRSVTVDGYDVVLHGAPTACRASTLAFTVTREGEPVDTLQPYLGAYGHLVSLRSGDLAYLHTHPARDAEDGVNGGPRIEFVTEFPTPARYRLYLDFAAGGRVHTAEFTVEVGGDGAAPAPSGRMPEVHGSDGGGSGHTH